MSCHAKDRDEQRFAVKLFVSCQALRMTGEMREIIDDLDGRRRGLFEEARGRVAELRRIAVERMKAAEAPVEADSGKPEDPESFLDDQQKKDLAHWKNLARYQPPVIDYLKAQVLTAEKRYEEALASLEKVAAAHLARPGLFLQTAELYVRLGRWEDAESVYAKALSIDPDNAQAHLGMCRMELRRKRFSAAAQKALDGLQRVYHYPVAHYLLGLALIGMKEFERAGGGAAYRDFFQSEFSGSACAVGGFAGEATG